MKAGRITHYRRARKGQRHIADGEVYNIAKFLRGIGHETVTAPSWWHEYRVWLIDTKTGKTVADWDSYFETYDGTHKLRKGEARRAMMEVINDVNKKGKVEDWFTIRR